MSTIYDELAGLVNPTVSQTQWSIWFMSTMPAVPAQRNDIFGLFGVQAEDEC
jgi:hypothetical protein